MLSSIKSSDKLKSHKPQQRGRMMAQHVKPTPAKPLSHPAARLLIQLCAHVSRESGRRPKYLGPCHPFGRPIECHLLPQAGPVPATTTAIWEVNHRQKTSPSVSPTLYQINKSNSSRKKMGYYCICSHLKSQDLEKLYLSQMQM